MLKIKRVYDPPERRDGERILVDRLWPRGLSKRTAAIDVWMKDLGPSHELRKWFGHDPARWKQFRQRYWKELKGKKDDVDVLRHKAREGKVTFIYAAHDEEHNGALALKEFIEQRGKG